MKALAILFALLVLAMPINAGPIELPTFNLFDQLFSWLTATWEAMGPVIVPIGDQEPNNQSVDPMGPCIDPVGFNEECTTQEMGPFIDPFG